MDDDKSDYSDEESPAVWRAASVVTTPFRALFSKQARKTYLGAILFFSTSIVLFGTAAVAYWVFYFNYVPQVGLARVVHLQFGDGNPWGIAALGADLVSLQQYDVSISLKLPRTPENLATGNFMLDLALLSPPQSSMMDANTSTSLIAHSRRPAILTYTSPLMDTAHTLARMPFYLIGWQRQAETLDVPMFEGIEFARGWRNVPGSLRLDIQSREQMQVYGVEVNFKAKFSGLRWLMYRWKLLSFFTFTSMFWSVSMISSSIAWLLLSQYWGSKSEGDRRIKGEKTEDGDTPIKEEFDEGSIKDEEDDAIKQEEIEQTASIAPPSNETEELESIRAIHHDSDSGRGTAFDGRHILGAQRRRSHLFDLPDP